MKTLLALGFSLFIATQAHAELVPYHFTGPQILGDLYVNPAVQDSDPAAGRELYRDAASFHTFDAAGIQEDGGGRWTVEHAGAVDHVTLDMNALSAGRPNLFTLTWDSPSGGAFPSLGTISNGHWGLHWLPIDQFPPNDLSGVFTSFKPGMVTREDFQQYLHPTPVPLPPAVWMFIAGLLVLVGIGRLRRVRSVGWCG